MGGRGATSTATKQAVGGGGIGVTVATGGGGSLNNVANQAPSPQNTPVVPNATTVLSQMTDQQLTQLYNQSRNVDMPNHLSDVSDATQRFVFTAGLNEKPQVLDDAQFAKYLKDNNIPQRDVLARSVSSANYTVNGTNIRLSPTQVTDLTKYGDLNYIGGKVGGQVYGAGTYFARTGGKPTGYGSNGATMIGVLSKNAKPISKYQLQSRTATWVQSHPQFAKAVGAFSTKTASIYALAQGFNVITDGANDYHNIIDRSAVVLKANNY